MIAFIFKWLLILAVAAVAIAGLVFITGIVTLIKIMEDL